MPLSMDFNPVPRVQDVVAACRLVCKVTKPLSDGFQKPMIR